MDDTVDLADALTAAHWPSLVPALGALTGDPARFARLLPERLDVLHPQGGLSEEQQREAAAVALDVLSAYHRGELSPAPVSAELVRALAAPMLGRDLDAYAELAAEELAIGDPDPRRPGWRAEEVAPGVELTVAVVGAGMSGLLAGHRLAQAGVRFTILEKNPDLGGTWLENTYPGCRVDVPSHLYTYSCDGDRDWSHHFAAQPDILDGFRRFAVDHGLLRQIRFGTEVLEMTWTGDHWTLTVRTPEGTTEQLAARVVITAAGQLNRPRLPDIPGRGRFAGPAFHTARWDHAAPLEGRRVAVIGTGASAVQVVPPLADQAAHLIVFQRSPAWLIPTPEFARAVDPRLRWLLATVPTYQRWYRLWLLRSVSDGLLPFATVDPSWEPTGRSVGHLNDRVRIRWTEHLEREFAGRPDLLGDLLPDYPPFAKRAIRDDGSFTRALARPDVSVVTTPISSIEAAGVRTGDGVLHELDVVVYGTGFQASRFLTPMRVRGRDGADLHDTWDGEPSAHLGITVPGFPNLFLLYGPNTNIVVNGSAIFFTECEVRHVMRCLRLLLDRGGAPIECSGQAHDEHRKRVDEGNAQRAWGVGDVRNWYRSASGRVSQNWPFTVLEYWKLTRDADPDDYPLPE